MMTQKEFILAIRESLKDYFDRSDISVETYRMELSQMDKDKRYAIRLGIYSGGDTVTGSLPGTQFRGVRVDSGKANQVVQTYNIQISVRVPDKLDYGDNNELELADLSEKILLWVNGLTNTIYTFSEGLISFFTWGNVTGISRPTPNYAQATATIYAVRNI